MAEIDLENPKTEQERDRALAAAVSDIAKEHGKEVIVDLNRKGEPMPVIPTGIFELDHTVLGVGGLPKGRIVEIYGPEGGGKTTTALSVVASAQAAGGRAAYIDMEHALDPPWCKLNGCDFEKMLISQPDYGEQALQITERLIESRALDVIVVDSVAALVPKAELDGEIGDANVGIQARMMSQTCRKLTGAVRKANVLLIFINQLREKIGVMFGNPETTPGGRALKFYASVRLDVRRIAGIKEGDVQIGNRVRFKCAKNKVAAPYKETEADLMFDCGLDRVGSVLDAAVAYGVVDKSGAWFSYKTARIGQGRRTAIDFVRNNVTIHRQILKDVLAARGSL